MKGEVCMSAFGARVRSDSRATVEGEVCMNDFLFFVYQLVIKLITVFEM